MMTIRVRTLLALLLAVAAIALAMLVNVHAASAQTTPSREQPDIWAQFVSDPVVWTMDAATVTLRPDGQQVVNLTITNHTDECLRIANDTMMLYTIDGNRVPTSRYIITWCQPPGPANWQIILPSSDIGVMMIGYDTAYRVTWE